MEVENRYRGRRFAGLILCTTLLAAGFFLGPPEKFPMFAQTLGLMYGAYLTGQSATDWKKYSADR